MQEESGNVKKSKKSPDTNPTRPTATTGDPSLPGLPAEVLAAIEEFNSIKKALSTPEPPWVLAQELNAKLQKLFPPPNACIQPPPIG